MEKEPQLPPDGPIVAEIRQARRAMLAECDYDIRRLAAKLRAKEAAAGLRSVSLRKIKTYTT